MPQGKENEYYLANFGVFGADFVAATGFDRVFRSPLFLGLSCALFVNLAARKEAGFYLVEGETVRLAYGYTLRLKSFEYLRYPDGRPQAWLLTVETERES